MTQDEQKRLAAEAAAAEVEDGMVLGLGTGSTAALVVEALGRRVREEGLRIVGVPTSERTDQQARRLGIPLAALGDHPSLDLVIDGADEVREGALDLVKGLGGALLREKLVAVSGKRLLIVVDETKLVPALGTKAPVPVEIVQFGWQATLRRLEDAGVSPKLRRDASATDSGGAAPYRTDGGNLIADCATGPIADPAALHARLKALVGVVETGLFVGMASRVIVGAAGQPRILERTGGAAWTTPSQ